MLTASLTQAPPAAGSAAARRPLAHRRAPLSLGAPLGGAQRRPLPLPTAFHSGAAMPMAQAELEQQQAAPAEPQPAAAEQPRPNWLSDAWKEEYRKTCRKVRLPPQCGSLGLQGSAAGAGAAAGAFSAR